jgi:hypothetical protein
MMGDWIAVRRTVRSLRSAFARVFAARTPVLVATLVLACGSDDEPAPLDPSEGQTNGGHATSVGAEESVGDDCEPCDAPRVCVEGECRLPPECGPDNCDGCCSEDDVCHPGDSGAACGAGGAACAFCSGDAGCVAGSCKLPCDSSCAGCCDEEGNCLDGVDADACGKAGSACESCGNDVCSNGTCVSAQCAATCEGCCDGNMCRIGLSEAACGAGGESCQTCSGGQSCIDAVCTVDPESMWDVVLVNAEVPPTNPDGGSWDPFGGLPDPYLEMNVGDVEGKSSHQSNTITPSWGTGEVVIENIPAQLLFYGPVYMGMWDYDPTWFDDFMFDCVVNVVDDMFSGDLVQSCVGSDHVIRWKLVPHEDD